MLPTPVHPGELLLDEFLLPRGLSQRAFAARIGWPPRRLNDLVTGKRNITPDSAAVLSRALGTSTEFWLYTQITWALHAARTRRAPEPAGAPRASSIGTA
jgi:addiction module HigA family antidote